MRIREVTSKQALMADNSHLLPSPKDKYTKPTSTSSFISPRMLLSGLSGNGLSESDSVKSPTSILDHKPFSNLINTFWSDKNIITSSSTKSWEKKPDSSVGLGIINDSLIDDNPNQKSSNPLSRMVLFGSQLKIQIPSFPSHISSIETPKSPTDFGIQTRNQLLGSVINCGFETPKSPRVFTGCLSASEMESSEDYTCVITHGPNPKTTHIFDNCIVKNCCGVVGFSSPKKENNSSTICLSKKSDYPSKNFLSFCCTCDKNLEQGKDIYIYRGEKAFCSHECRDQEILKDEGIEKSGLVSPFKTCY